LWKSGLHRQGYFTIRGIKVGVHEMDILADPCTAHQFTATDVGTRILKAACEQGLTWSSQVDDDLAVEARVEQFKRDVAAGRVKIRTPEEIAADEEARRAAEIVKNTEGASTSRATALRLSKFSQHGITNPVSASKLPRRDDRMTPDFVGECSGYFRPRGDVPPGLSEMWRVRGVICCSKCCACGCRYCRQTQARTRPAAVCLYPQRLKGATNADRRRPRDIARVDEGEAVTRVRPAPEIMMIDPARFCVVRAVALLRRVRQRRSARVIALQLTLQA